MGNSNIKNFLLIALTLLIGMMLTILPLPHWIAWYRPSWVLMILFFWMVALPHRIGVGIAFCVGIFLDLLMGTVLGQQALVLSIIAYFIIRFQTQVRSLPLWQLSIVLFVALFSYLAISYWIMSLMGRTPDSFKYWLPAITTLFLWPWVRLVLKDYQNRFNLS